VTTEARGWDDVRKSHQPRNAGASRSWEGKPKEPPLKPPKGTQPYNYLDFRLLTSSNVAGRRIRSKQTKPEF
jgi:hypothetical protein